MKTLLKSITLSLVFLATSSVMVAQSIEINDFRKLSVGGNFDVKLSKSNSPGVKVKMLKGDIEDMKIGVEDGTLTIKQKGKSWGLGRNKVKAKVIVYYTQLKQIKTSAGASLMAEEPVVAEDMTINCSSGSSLKLELDVTNLSAGSSSGSNMRLGGTAQYAEFGASSGSSLSASALVSDEVEADVSSGASISCHANKKIDAEASSGGSVTYAGNPESKNVSKSSGGSVSGK